MNKITPGKVENIHSSPLCMLFRKRKVKTKEIAIALGVQQQIVKNWCRGVGFPDAKQAVKIANLLGCSLFELYFSIIRTKV